MLQWSLPGLTVRANLTVNVPATPDGRKEALATVGLLPRLHPSDSSFNSKPSMGMNSRDKKT